MHLDAADPTTLHPDPRNPRLISPEQLDALTQSIRTFGFVQPLIVRRSDRLVVGGMQRLTAALRIGLDTVPVVWVDLEDDQVVQLNLALNRISGEWDNQLLARLLADLEAHDADIGLTGFGEDEVATLLRSLQTRERRDRPETFDLDAALDVAGQTTRAKAGDRWMLGDHTVVCGDATNAATVDGLLDGTPADIAFTDPPYGVALGDHGGQQRGQRRRRIRNDSLPPVEWEAFCAAWTANLVRHVDGALYVCMSSKEWPTVSRFMQAAGGHWSDTIVWDKQRFVLGRADYQRQYEPIWYGWREDARHHWNGGRDQGDVWTIPRPSVSELHPTMKPIELVERALENSSRPGGRVLDLFLGSGTTLIAAERTGRRCVGLELEPRYVDVIVARWESFTGETAVCS